VVEEEKTLVEYSGMKIVLHQGVDLSWREILNQCSKLHAFRQCLKRLVEASSDPTILSNLDASLRQSVLVYMGDGGEKLISQLSGLSEQTTLRRNLLLRLYLWYVRKTIRFAEQGRGAIQQALRLQIINSSDSFEPLMCFVKKLEEIVGLCRAIVRYKQSGNRDLISEIGSHSDEVCHLIDNLHSTYAESDLLEGRAVEFIKQIESVIGDGNISVNAEKIANCIKRFVDDQRQIMNQQAGLVLDQILGKEGPYR